MITILPLNRILVAIAILYAAVIALILTAHWNVTKQTDFVASIKVALAGATILNLILLGIIYFAWKWIWKTLPILNSVLFPDLNGEWSMHIEWSQGQRQGTVQAIAKIKQDLLRISMEVESESSDSETMMAHPKKDPESGRPILYYVYRVIPKSSSGGVISSYQGAAILKVSNTGHHQLSGNYFTSQMTGGRFVLERR